MPDEVGPNESATRPSNISPNHGDEAGLLFGNLDDSFDGSPFISLTMDDDIFYLPPFCCVSLDTIQPPSGMFVVKISELRPRTDL